MVTLLQDEHAHLVFTLNFELCALLNCLFFAVGSLSILFDGAGTAFCEDEQGECDRLRA